MRTDRETPAPDSGHGTVIKQSRDPNVSARIVVPEIARRLEIGRLSVYSMLEQGILPGVRLGRRWIITRRAFEEWERTCGMRGDRGLTAKTEVKVLN